MANTSPHSTPSDAFVWFFLLLGAVIHIPFSLPGISTQVAVFDFILPLIIIWYFTLGRLVVPDRTTVIVFLTILTAVLGHSTAIYLFKDSLQTSWLAKETVKLIVIIIEFFMLMMLMRTLGSTLPPRKVLGWVFSLSVVAVGTLAYLMLDHEYFFFARTVYCVALAGLFFLLTADVTWANSTYHRALAALIGLAVAGVAVLSLSKAIAGLVIAMGAWIVLSRFIPTAAANRKLFIATCLFLFAGIGMFLVVIASENIDFLGRMDSIERSISVRISLWTLGLEAFWQNFLLGLGLGQFWEVVVSDVTLAAEGHRYVHSTFMSMLIELGLLGFVFAIGIATLLCLATRGWPLLAQPLFALLVFVPLTIHDGHSIRMLLVIISLGFMRFVMERENRSREVG